MRGRHRHMLLWSVLLFAALGLIVAHHLRRSLIVGAVIGALVGLLLRFILSVVIHLLLIVGLILLIVLIVVAVFRLLSPHRS